MEAYKLYITINPEAEENRWAINIAFVVQTSDIRQKKKKKN